MITIETIFAELLWQRALDLKIPETDLLLKTESYQKLKNQILDELKSKDKIDFWFGQYPKTKIINKTQLNDFIRLLTDPIEEIRVIERAVFIANQEAYHNEDEMNLDR
jgi:hypothetical protein